MPEYDSVNDALAAMAEQMADLRGEAIGARLLAGLAVEWVVSNSPDPAAQLRAFERAVDGALDALRFAPDSDAALNATAREIARLRAHGALAEIKLLREL